MNIKEINEELSRLHALRNEVADRELKETKKEFLELKWTKDCTFIYSEGFGAYGNTEFILSGDFPKKYIELFYGCQVLTVMGDSKNYQENVNARRGNMDWARMCDFYTCTPSIFVNFVKFIKQLGCKIEVRSDFPGKFLIYEALNEITRQKTR